MKLEYVELGLMRPDEDEGDDTSTAPQCEISKTTVSSAGLGYRITIHQDYASSTGSERIFDDIGGFVHKFCRNLLFLLS